MTGIVDWDTAGYYPEYWDYTKAMYEGFRWTRRYNGLAKSVFSSSETIPGSLTSRSGAGNLATAYDVGLQGSSPT